MSDIDTLSKEVHRKKQKPSLDDDVVEHVSRELERIDPDLSLLRRENGEQTFILSRISEAAQAYPDDRDTPVCTCNSPICPLKNGELPGPVLVADDIDESFQVWRMRHQGDPVIIDEARREFAEKRTEVKSALNDCLIAMRRGKPPGEARTESGNQRAIDDESEVSA